MKEEIVVKEPAEEVNVVLNGNLKEEQKVENKPLTARQILGLDKKRNNAYEYGGTNPVKPTQQKKEPEKPKSLKELILTPPQIDIDEYFKDVRKEQVPEKQEIQIFKLSKKTT